MFPKIYVMEKLMKKFDKAPEWQSLHGEANKAEPIANTKNECYVPFKLIDIPESFKCPITREIMIDPVVAADERSYERASITKWLETHDTSPISNLKLKNKETIFNKNLKDEILAFVEKNHKKFETELIEAVKRDDVETISMLSKLEINVNIQDNEGWTPLHHAAFHGKIKVLQRLIELKANSQNTANYSPECKLLEISGYERSRAVREENFKLHPIHLAVINGQKEIIEAILSAKINPNITDSYNWTALHWAVSQNDLAMAQLLLKNNINIDEKDNEGNTALHIAAQYGDEKLLSLLLENEAEYKARNYQNQTPADLATLNQKQGAADFITKKSKEIKRQKINALEEAFLKQAKQIDVLEKTSLKQAKQIDVLQELILKVSEAASTSHKSNSSSLKGFFGIK
jgi:ankyrin repeat protein